MANVAFRLFKIEVHKNNARTALGDGNPLGKDSFQTTVLNAAAALKGEVLHESPRVYLDSRIFQPEQPAKSGDPCFLIRDIRPVFSDVTEIEIFKGKYGDLDYLIRNDGDLSDIHDDAATRKFLVRISFPKDRNCCYIASQMRAASQAGTDLFDHISYYLHKKAVRQRDHRIEQVADWFRFISVALVDENRFDSALGKAEVESFKLVKKGVSSNGTKTQEKFTVEYSKPSHIHKTEGLGILKKLTKFATKSAEYPPAVGAIAALFPSWASQNIQNWDDGSITFIENQKRTTISALAIAQLFVYPLGDKASIQDLWAEANSRLTEIGHADGIIIPTIV